MSQPYNYQHYFEMVYPSRDPFAVWMAKVEDIWFYGVNDVLMMIAISL